MDAFAVALASGISLKKVDCRQTFRLAWHFGFFQAMMPVIGWSVGFWIQTLFSGVDHWIAFVLLSIIGTKMFYESFSDDEKRPFHDPTKGLKMVMLSIATSIDALAVGFSIAMLGHPIWMPALVIGCVCCFLTTLGLYLGCWLGSKTRLGNYAEASGGLILICIGLRILYEHNVFF
ncbi:MAG: manganese efflux pump [Candidatus Brocadiae bacterium]|nr:manganese efflux pump [Candidatus Brocadiia bacterium]